MTNPKRGLICRGCGRMFTPRGKVPTKGGHPFHSRDCLDRYVARTGDGPEDLKDLLRF